MMSFMPRSQRVDPDGARFGRIIRRVRRQRGWTIVKLARRSGMNATYLGILERGGNSPSLATIIELAEVLGVDAGDLVREVAAGRKPKRPVAPEENLPVPSTS